MIRLDDPDNPLAIELRQETAAAYFAACRKMVDALDALNAFDRSLASAAFADAQIGRRTELLDHAAERVHFVVIQREAMKLLCAEEFFEEYGISAEVRARLGARRKQ